MLGSNLKFIKSLKAKVRFCFSHPWFFENQANFKAYKMKGGANKI
jgi:hypothetical protein